MEELRPLFTSQSMSEAVEKYLSMHSTKSDFTFDSIEAWGVSEEVMNKILEDQKLLLCG